MRLRKLLVALIVLATAIFSVAVAFERSKTDVHSTGTEDNHAGGEGGEETHAGEGGEEQPSEPTSDESAVADEGTILGVDPEATPVVVVVVIASLALAGAIWLRPGWRWLLLVTVIGMFAFAVMDVRELVHQFNEDNSGLGLAAIVVATLHAAAGVVALILFLPKEGVVA